MIKVLNIIGSVNYGGAETFLINIYRNIDLQSFQFDFLIYEKALEKSYAAEIEQMGGRIFLVPPKSQGITKSLKAIYKIVRENNYQIVWRHTESMFKAIDLVAAKLGGAQKTILHSHNTNASRKENFLGKLVSPFVTRFVTNYYACGKEAGDYLFKAKEYLIVKNGIDVNRFLFNIDTRLRYKKSLNIDDCYVFGHVGRFEVVKNHVFLIQIFKTILKYEPKSVLLLVGDGELKKEIESKVNELGISDKVYFMGLRDDISQLMSVMDVLIFPSLYEGMPVTLVEAQTADLPSLVSDTIDSECKVTENIQFESLMNKEEVWAKRAIEMIKDARVDRSKEIREAGYDIKDTAGMLMNLWKEQLQ